MKRTISWLASIAIMITALSVMLVPTSSAPTVSAAANDIDLLRVGKCEPNSEAYATVTDTDEGIRVDVLEGVDSQNNGYGLAVEPQLEGLVVDANESNSLGFIHLVMESDVPFRVTSLDRDPSGSTRDKWIIFGNEFFNVFVPEDFEFSDPDWPTIYEALYDGFEFMRPGKYDVYLYYGGVYTWKYNNWEYDWDPYNANLTAMYFETLFPGTFTIQEMTLTSAEGACSHGGVYEPGTYTTAPVYIPITLPYGDAATTNPPVNTTAADAVTTTTAVGRYGNLHYTISGGEATVTAYDGDDLHLTIPDKLGGAPVTAIGYSAFANNVRLQGIALPSTLKTIEDYAFNSCVSLESIDIPDGVTSIDYEAFSDCFSLYEVTLPSSLREIGDWAFDNCPIGFLEIPDGVTSIPNYAFSAVSTIVIPGSVTYVDDRAFGYDAYLLNHIIFTGTKAQFKEIDQNLPIDTVAYHYGAAADSVTKVAEHKHCVDYGYSEWHCSVCDTTYHEFSKWDVEAYGGLMAPVGHVIGADGLCEYCGTKDTMCLTSPHPYATDILHRYKVRYPDAASVSVTFSEETLLEDGYDWLFVYDASGALVEKYTGDELAGQTITVQGDTFEMILQADTTDSEFGFAATAIEADGLVERGNINGDDKIDMRDAFALYIAASGGGNLTDAQKKAADMNSDNKIDMRDAFALYIIAAGG